MLHNKILSRMRTMRREQLSSQTERWHRQPIFCQGGGAPSEGVGVSLGGAAAKNNFLKWVQRP